jgi:hypothetical protein
MATQEAYSADKIEFFHDRSGLDTSKQNILANTKKYIYGKVTRELVKGSLEVSSLPGYGAVQVGMHKFLQQPGERCHISSKQVYHHLAKRTWKMEDNQGDQSSLINVCSQKHSLIKISFL